MRVLLTGASGFIGAHVLETLTRGGIDTVCAGRHCPVGKPEFIEADLLTVADFKPLMQQAGASHLLHLAWYAEHGKYWTSPLNLRWVEASVRLVEAFCNSGGQHVVAAGTCAEYDWSHGYCREESTPLAPATLYGAAKEATHRLVSAVCARHEVSCAWGRVFLPYGKGEASARLVPSLIEVFRGRREAFGVNAEAYRDFLHVTDVAAAFAALLQEEADGAYNISSGQPVQLATLVRELARLLHADPALVLSLAGERRGEPPLLVGENLKLQARGWQPALSLSQGLHKVVEESGA